jgi:hypothetical protein
MDVVLDHDDLLDKIPPLRESTSKGGKELTFTDVVAALGPPPDAAEIQPDSGWAKWPTPSGAALRVEYRLSTGEITRALLHHPTGPTSGPPQW